MNYLDSLKQKFPAISAYTDEEIVSVLPDIDPSFKEMSPEQIQTFATTNEGSSLWALAKSGFHSVMGNRDVSQAVSELDELNDPNFASLTNIKPKTGLLMGISADELRRRSIAAAEGNEPLIAEAQKKLDRGNEHLRKASNVSLSPTTERFLTGSDSGRSGLDDFLADPVTIISEIGAQSAYGSVESLGTGLLASAAAGPVGLALGSGASSGRIEFANTVVEELKAAGVDVTNARALQQALAEKPELYESAITTAKTRATAIGTFDAATMGLASKSFGVGEGLKKHASNLLMQSGVQASGGAAGEAVAQLATEGEISDGRAVAAEAAGEMVTAPVDVYAATRNYMSEANAKVVESGEAVAAAGGDVLDQAVARGEAQNYVTPEAVQATKAESILATEQPISESLVPDAAVVPEQRAMFEPDPLSKVREQKLEPETAELSFKREVADAGHPIAMPIESVLTTANRFANKQKLSGVKVNVVSTEAALPEAIRSQINVQSAEGQIKAAFHEGGIYVVADRMATPVAVETAILHEATHYGGHELLGSDVALAYRKVWADLGGTQGLKAKAEALGISMEPYFSTAEASRTDGSMTQSQRAMYLVDEFLALANQQKAVDTLPEKTVRAIQEFIGVIRDVLRRNGFAELPNLTDSDIAYLLKNISKASQQKANAKVPHFMKVTKDDEADFFFQDLNEALNQPAMSRIDAKDDAAIPVDSTPNKIGSDAQLVSEKVASEPMVAGVPASEPSIANAGGSAMFSREAAAEHISNVEGFEAPAENIQRQAMSWIADKFHVLKKVQENIEANGTNIEASADAYLAEELFHGKAENDLRQMRETFVEPLAKKLAEFGITQAQLDEYLYAKHATERNAHIAEINPDMPESGSGMTDQSAAQVLASIRESGKQNEYDQVANIVYDMLAARRDAIRAGQLEDDSLLDAWESKYEFYVPLKGYAENEQQAAMPRSGKGFTVGGKESKRAMGRKSEAASPSSYAIQDLTETLIRARKNEVGNAFLELVESNPSPDYWQVYTDDNPEIDRRIVKRTDPDTGEKRDEVVEQAVPMAMMSDRYFTTKRDGQTYYIKLEDPRLMKAMKNIGPDTSNFIIQNLSKVSRFLSSVNTSYNPEFVVGNFARDIQTAVLNLKAEQSRDDGKIKGEAIVKQTVKDVPVAMKAICRSLRGKSVKNQEWADYFDEFRSVGAKTGWFDMKDIDGQADDIQQLISIAKGGFKGKALKWMKASGKLVDDLNSSVENAIRLSAYVNARKAGISQKKAASLAKNMTVNFNRKGEAGTTLNALYMFANASIQGSMNFARTMGSLNGHKGDPIWSRLNTAQKISAGLMIGAYALAMANRFGAGDDDDGVNWYDKVPQYVKERNLVIMKSLLGGDEDGSYWKIPLPYGYNIFHVLGTSTEAVFSGNTGVGESAVDITLAALGSFSPLGFQTSSELSTAVLKNLTPTIGKPIVDVATNENFMGSSIYNENFPFGTKKPDSSLARRSTPEGYRAIAEFLNEVSGGSKWRSGAIDINPDVMRYFVDYALGGAGKFSFSKIPDNAYRLFSESDMPISRTVFLSRLNGQVLPYQDQDVFYDRRNEIAQIDAEFKGLRGAERARFYREHQGKLKLRGLVKETEKRLKAMREQRNRIYSAHISVNERDRRLEALEKRVKNVINQFNYLYIKSA